MEIIKVAEWCFNLKSVSLIRKQIAHLHLHLLKECAVNTNQSMHTDTHLLKTHKTEYLNWKKSIISLWKIPDGFWIFDVPINVTVLNLCTRVHVWSWDSLGYWGEGNGFWGTLGTKAFKWMHLRSRGEVERPGAVREQLLESLAFPLLQR